RRGPEIRQGIWLLFSLAQFLSNNFQIPRRAHIERRVRDWISRKKPSLREPFHHIGFKRKNFLVRKIGQKMIRKNLDAAVEEVFTGWIAVFIIQRTSGLFIQKQVSFITGF